MSRYQPMFERLQRKGEGAFIPFTVLGDPDEQTCLALIEAMVQGGADALELGLPFSDPVADGPTIQLAADRALSAGFGQLDRCFSLVAEIRARHKDLPIGLLGYANLAYRRGVAAFYRAAAHAGADSLLLADLPVHQAASWAEKALAAGMDPVFIAPPNASSRQLDLIAALGRGYTYVVTRYGVTGARAELSLQHGTLLQALRDRNAAPSVMGFGISSRQAVREAIGEGAKGAIAGSALVSLVERFRTQPDHLCELMGQAVADFKAGSLPD
jgi:tryptophan synthase alpha chain